MELSYKEGASGSELAEHVGLSKGLFVGASVLTGIPQADDDHGSYIPGNTEVSRESTILERDGFFTPV